MDQDPNAQPPPRRFFSKSLVSLREKLSLQREQQPLPRTDDSPNTANILRKRCFIGDPADALAEKKKRTSSPATNTLDQTSPSLPSPPSPSSPSGPSLDPPSSADRSISEPLPTKPSPSLDNLPTPSPPLSQSFTTSEPRPLEKIKKLQSSHLEICAKSWVDLSYSEIEEAIEVFREDFLNGNGEGIDWENDERLNALRAKTDSIYFEGGVAHELPHCHLYKLEGDGPMQAHQSEEISMVQQWKLPNQEFHDLWQNLMYDSDIKNRLLLFSSSLAIFGEHGVNPGIISNNRIILLYGPPGTGKTSLCKALAQKLAIRMRYRKPSFVEVNAHSLFSKWFSESGKLVTKLFVDLREQLEDEDTFLFVLVDEVESLTSARKSALSGAEPSDSIRAVNALLTQIDQLRTCHNVLVLTTSNITEAIDAAFVDRADVKQFIGLPSHFARYQILGSCINELKRTEIVASAIELLSFEGASKVTKGQEGEQAEGSAMLYEIAAFSEGMSGRALRKFPLVTHALSGGQVPVPLLAFLGFLKKYVQEQRDNVIPTA